MSKAKKVAKFFLFIIAILILIGAISFGCFYLYATEIRFDYTNTSLIRETEDYEYDLKIYEEGYKMNFPYFGNSATLQGGMGHAYIFGIGEENEDIYYAVNNILYDYASDIILKYDNEVKVNYSIESDDKTLSIHFSGYGYPNGIEAEPETIEDTFIFDIENANKEKLPKLISSSN